MLKRIAHNITARQLNFSQVYPAYASSSETFDLQHLNGDIHQITPKNNFTGFKTGQSQKIKSAPDDINQYASTIWLYNNEPQLALDDSHLDFAIIPTPNPWWLKILIHQPLPNNFTISGIQGQLWSETVRRDEQAEYMIYPRLLALAERACLLAIKPVGKCLIMLTVANTVKAAMFLTSSYVK